MIAEARLGFRRRLRPVLALHGWRLVRFCLVGSSGVVVNNAVLLGLVAGLRLHPLAAAALATECAIVSNFLLNDRWTFADARRSAASRWPRRLASYNLLTLGGLVISVGTFAALTGLGLHYLAANLVGIGAGMLWNYGANHRWTWSRLRPA